MSKDRAQYLAAERHKTKVGAQRKAVGSFVSKIRGVAGEYMQKGLGPSAAMEEIKAAIRELDRSQPSGEGKTE